MTKTLAFYARTAQRRGASIVKHLEGHKDQPYEVIYDTKVRGEIFVGVVCDPQAGRRFCERGAVMARQWVIARDHKTDLNRARQYRTQSLTWSDQQAERGHFTAAERKAEHTWCRQNSTADWDVFYYKDPK
jgi:hypothetical protein